MKIITSKLLFCLLLFVLPVFVSANNYKVTPRVIDREVEPRDIFTETITVTNNKHYKITLYPSVNIVALDEGGDIKEFSPPSMSDNTQTVSSWLAISRSQMAIDPGETKEIPLHVKIHPKAEAGIYHALIGFGEGHNRPTAEAKVANGTAPGVIVTLNVSQNKKEFLKLSKFIIDRFVTKPENSAVSYTLTNPGSADVIPTGEIIISDGRGNEVATIPVNPDKNSLAPGQETTYSTAAPTDDLLGKYKAFLSVDYGTAQLASVYDTTFFYVIPWQKLMIIFSIILVVTIVITLLIHRKLASGSGYDDGSDELPLYIKDTTSETKDHDISLKK